MAEDFMIYGASGYTGRLLARRAVELGRRPILGGRNAEKLHALGNELSLECRVACLDDPTAMAGALRNVRLVLHAAGPFSKTSRAMLDACLSSGTHYLDISGEIGVFEQLSLRHAEAKDHDIMVLPGVGFLVAATDCLSAEVFRRLPAAVSLRIGISRPGFFAHGSLKTMIGLLDDSVTVRRAGRLAQVAVGVLEQRFDFGAGEVVCTAGSGAEVVACHHTTGIPNIEVYFPAEATARVAYRLGAALSPLLRTDLAQVFMKALVDQTTAAPPTQAAPQVAIAIAEDRLGEIACSVLRTPDAYDATATLALAIVDEVLGGRYRAGFSTPGQLCGPRFLSGLPGVALETRA